MSVLKIVVVGPGLMGVKHIQAIRQTDGMELSAIIAPSSDINRETALVHDVPLFHSLDDYLVVKEADGIILSTPNQFHFDYALQSIEAQIPILIEKPITTSTDESREIVRRASEKNVPVLIGHHRIYNSLLVQLREVLDEGILGQLVTILGSAQLYKPTQYFQDATWRTSIGGGPILINFIHEVSVLRYLLGEIESVQAMSSNKIRRYEVEDTATICMKFKNGVLGSFLVSDTTASPMSWEHTTSENPMYPHYNDDCYIFTGTRGSFSFPNMRLSYYPTSTEPSWKNTMSFRELSKPIYTDPLLIQMKHFKDVILKEDQPKVSAEDGHKNLVVIEAIKRSIDSGHCININHL